MCPQPIQPSKQRSRSARSAIICAAATAAALASLGSPPAHAGDLYWNVTTGLWGTGSNWEFGVVPGPIDNAIVNYLNGTARITNSAIGSVASVSVRNSASVQISNQGSILCATDFIVGQASTQGTLNIQTNNPLFFFPGGMTVSGNLRLGVLGGKGYVNQDAGRVTVGGSAIVGDSAATYVPTAVYNLSGTGALQATNLLVGWNTSTYGALNLSEYATANVQNLSIGRGRYSGTVTQTGGQMTVSDQFTLEAEPSISYATGLYDLIGGTLNSASTTIDGGVFNFKGGNASLGDLFMEGGTIKVSGGGNKVLRAEYLYWGSGSIDLANNSMELADQDPSEIGYVIGWGYAGGHWNIPFGITSSFAAATALLELPHRTALGYGPEGNGTLIKYTFVGDANLDGVVNVNDFIRLASNFGLTGRIWSQGDFNYDGTVNVNDFTQLAANFGYAPALADGIPTPADWANLAALVPEPAGAMVMSVAAAALAVKRSRRPMSCT